VIVTPRITGDNYGVTVGYSVEVGRFVGSIRGVGVQVGGSEIRVAVGGGIKMVGMLVGLGNGLISESGLEKMDSITNATTSVAINVRTVNKSQTDSFFIL
jgi:hypothetical protein